LTLILDLSSFHPLPQCVCMLHHALDFPRLKVWNMPMPTCRLMVPPSEAPGSVRFNRPVVIRSLQMMPTSLSGAGGELWVRGRLGGAEVWRHAWGRGGACGIGELVMGRPGGIWGGLPTIRVMTLRYFGDVLLLILLGLPWFTTLIGRECGRPKAINR
jgi:hypothetical protein